MATRDRRHAPSPADSVAVLSAGRSGPLDTYNAKRNFARTPEPAGALAAASQHPTFVVQKHAARRLHFDFRLEVDGVLKSWALTRGPSLNPEDRRLAVRTEDHPLAYAQFEGVIPKGEYGGGTVMLWDSGTWRFKSNGGQSPLKAIEAGKIHFSLFGQRLRGEWVLVRMNDAERHENWLLRKLEDEAVDGTDLVARYQDSVVTGRTLDQIEGDMPAQPTPSRRARGRNVGRLPGFRPVQLATLTSATPTGDGWLHELKYDGYRAIVACHQRQCRIYTRAGLDWTRRYRVLADAFTARAFDATVFDGEVVVFDQRGIPDFSLLQAALDENSATVAPPLSIVLFDVRLLAGREMEQLPLIERKHALRDLIGTGDATIRFAEHVVGNGDQLWSAACRHGIEGIVSKRIDAPYRPGRSAAWRKIKCDRRQEFIVIGAARSSARDRPFASLLLAVRDENGALRYVGKVGSGFDASDLQQLGKQLAPLARDHAAASVPKAAAVGAMWVDPQLVVEVHYAEMTGSGCLRHARFVGQRQDKRTEEIVMETPEAVPPAVEISHPERIVYPESGLTKQMVADYYRQISPFMLPHLAGRPVSLVRCPQGRQHKCFFQKHAPDGFGQHIHPVDIVESDGDHAAYFHVDNAYGLLDCVQMGALEFHGWGARHTALETPDRVIFDLDPDNAVNFSAVVEAALLIRKELLSLGLQSFAMLSGGKGVHVVVPLIPTEEWPVIKDFARRFAHALSDAMPDRLVATMSKARRKQRIFIDWLRNERGATSVQPYSLRAREHAPIATPVSWKELKTAKSADRFCLERLEELLKHADTMRLAQWGEADQRLPAV